MKDISIVAAWRIAEEFCVCAQELDNAESKLQSAACNRHLQSPKHRGALRRKSMDLTRALAEMRKP
jgi:hypothetical protein